MPSYSGFPDITDAEIKDILHTQREEELNLPLPFFKEEGDVFPVENKVFKHFLKNNKKVNFRRFFVACGDRGNVRGYARGVKWCGAKLDDIWRDATYSLVLIYNSPLRGRKAAAIVGFDCYETNDGFIVVHIRQLQGVKGFKKVLGNLRWERLLLYIVTKWAFEEGFEEVRVQSAQENRWSTRKSEEKKVIFKIRYDKTPLRMGFKKHENGKYTYIKKEDFEPIEL